VFILAPIIIPSSLIPLLLLSILNKHSLILSRCGKPHLL
jgi:hypothetical protein